jgi:hypothetical protein
MHLSVRSRGAEDDAVQYRWGEECSVEETGFGVGDWEGWFLFRSRGGRRIGFGKGLWRFALGDHCYRCFREGRLGVGGLGW